MTGIVFPHLKTTADQIAPNVLVVGDPKRAVEAAKLLTDAHEVGNNREFITLTGAYRGKPVSICSHGVGAAGASVCFEELFQAGAKTVIRAGTCGALYEPINDGDLLIATAAVREDGTSPYLIPMEFPAFTERHVLEALETEAKAYDAVRYTGVMLSRANFYPGLLPDNNDVWMKAGVLGVEMEVAVLLVQASLHGARAGGIFVSDGNLAREKQADVPNDPAHYNPHREVVVAGVQRMLKISLGALSSLAE
jgi:uridine phosphorylase